MKPVISTEFMTSGVSQDKPDFPFALPSYEDWLNTARQELDGADPIEKLTVRKGDIEIIPFYEASKKNSPDKPLLKPSLNSFNGPRNWINSPKILATDEGKANKLALAYLNSGAEGILFDCPSSEINPTMLLDKISLSDCTINFLIHQPSPAWSEDFIRHSEKNFDKTEIRGSIYWRNLRDINADHIHAFAQWPQFYSIGIIVDTHQQATEELARALTNAVSLIDSLAGKMDVQNILPQISFSVSVGNDFFLEIAKIKSLRSLWQQIKGAYQVPSTKPLHVHAHSGAWVNASFQPHGNMIKSTTAAMAAISGGCDSLTVEPEDSNHETMSRIALNVSSILREESHFSKVADPTAGSYYLDSLTHQLSEKAWSKFQQSMK